MYTCGICVQSKAAIMMLQVMHMSAGNVSVRSQLCCANTGCVADTGCSSIHQSDTAVI